MKTEATEPPKTDQIAGIGAFLVLVGVLGIFVPIDPWTGATARLVALGVNGSLATLLLWVPRGWVLSLVIGRTLITVGAQAYRASHARATPGGWALWAIALLMNVFILIGCSSWVRDRLRSRTHGREP